MKLQLFFLLFLLIISSISALGFTQNECISGYYVYGISDDNSVLCRPDEPILINLNGTYLDSTYLKLDSSNSPIYLSGSHASRTSRLEIKGLAGSAAGVPLFLINQTTSNGNSNLFKIDVNGVNKFLVDNEGDLYTASSISSGTFGFYGYTTYSWMNFYSNDGLYIDSSSSIPNRATVFLGDGSVDRYNGVYEVTTASSTKDSLTVQRYINNTNTYYNSGSLLRLFDGSVGNTVNNMSYLVWGNSTKDYGILDYRGYLGIGTVKPTHSLNVIGDVNITGNLYVNNSPVCTQDNGLCEGSGSGSGSELNEHVVYFDSGVASLTTDSFYIGQGGAGSNSRDYYVILPNGNMTEIGCHIETNSGIASFNVTDNEGYHLGLSCQTFTGVSGCRTAGQNVPHYGFITIDFEEVSGNTGGHGTCYVKYFEVPL